ncbi:hypothetical protein Tco_0305264 [Tanacetum coccineum]
MTSLSKRYERLKKIPEEFGIQSALPAPVPEQASSQTLGRKIKHMELEPEVKVPGLECNRSLHDCVPFVNNMVIEEPEYGIFFKDIFGDHAFQRWEDIHKLRKLIADHPDQEKLKSKKVKLEALGYHLYVMLTWGWFENYFCVLIDIRVDQELKDNMIIVIPNLEGNGYVLHTVWVEYEWKPPRCKVCKVLKFQFKSTKQVYQPVPKKNGARENGGNINKDDMVDNSTPNADIESLGAEWEETSSKVSSFGVSSWHGARVGVRTYLLDGAIDGGEANGIIRDPKLELESSRFTFETP